MAKRERKQKQKVERITREQRVAVSTAEDMRNASTSELARMRSILDYEVGAIDAQIAELTGALAAARARRAYVNAKSIGVGMVIARR